MIVVGGTWAVWGLVFAPRRDVLGAIMFLFLLRFLFRGRQPLVYAGAFVVTSYLEIVGTNLGAWAWAHHGPMGIVPQGNPPSGMAGGYCFLDAAGLAFAPLLLVAVARFPRGFWRWRTSPRPVLDESI